ncbi:MAG: hypothetical protein AAGD25_29140 [Cyanobacteria bacterium P01_F01_bin.150]
MATVERINGTQVFTHHQLEYSENDWHPVAIAPALRIGAAVLPLCDQS